MADLHTIHLIQQVLSRGLNVTVDADDGSMQVHPFALQGLEYLRNSGRIYYTTLLMTICRRETRLQAMIHCLRSLIGRSRTCYDINRP